MTSYEQRLTEIATEMFSAEQLGRLDLISVSSPFNLQAMSDFDDSIPGPSMRRLSEAVRQRFERTGEVESLCLHHEVEGIS